jgi:hypothetical protein
MRKLKGPKSPRVESLEKLMERMKAAPESHKERKDLLLAGQSLLDARMKEVARKCGDVETLRSVAESALRKRESAEELNELENDVLVIVAAMKVLEEIKKRSPPS